MQLLKMVYLFATEFMQIYAKYTRLSIKRHFELKLIRREFLRRQLFALFMVVHFVCFRLDTEKYSSIYWMLSDLPENYYQF